MSSRPALHGVASDKSIRFEYNRSTMSSRPALHGVASDNQRRVPASLIGPKRTYYTSDPSGKIVCVDVDPSEGTQQALRHRFEREASHKRHLERLKKSKDFIRSLSGLTPCTKKFLLKYIDLSEKADVLSTLPDGIQWQSLLLWTHSGTRIYVPQTGDRITIQMDGGNDDVREIRIWWSQAGNWVSKIPPVEGNRREFVFDQYCQGSGAIPGMPFDFKSQEPTGELLIA